MKRVLHALLVLSVMLLAAKGAGAQSIHQPIYAYREGDIWRFDSADNTATQLTDWGYNGGPILAPDGRHIAYLSTTVDFVAQFEAGNLRQAAGSAPADIWVMDIASEGFRLVADQTGAGADGYLRSLPSWSPEGRRLAWLELDPLAQDLDSATLQAHSLDSGETSTLLRNVNLGFQGVDIHMPSLRWGAGGIAWLLFAYLQGDANPFLFINFFDPVAGTMAQYNLGLKAEGDNNVRDFEWVQHLGRSTMGLQIQDYWEVLDPQNGDRTRLLDPPRLKNRYLSGGLQLIPKPIANGRGGWDNHWYAAAGGSFYNTGYRSARVNRNYRPGLSSDGTQMAWRDDDRISTWRLSTAASNRALVSDASARRTFPIPQPVSVVWAPTEWVTTSAVIPGGAAQRAQGSDASCALPPLLSVGLQAVVSPGLANRVRNGASLSADAIGRIQAGEVVTVEAGPVCADAYHWYYIRNANIAGWTAEGADGEYWLLRR